MIKKDPLLETFQEVWEQLMSTPIHLDSVLAKLTPRKKSILAQIVPRILSQPLSLCAYFGVGVSEGEPWNLTLQERIRWRPAFFLAKQMSESLDQGIPLPPGEEGDFPPLMIEEWKASWGEEVTRKLCQTLVLPPPLGLRVSKRVSREEVWSTLKRGSRLPVKSTLSVFAPMGIRLEAYTPIMRTSPYEEGLIEIQDEGSQWVSVFALDPPYCQKFLTPIPVEPPPLPRDFSISSLTIKKVIDACAGAGGKTLAIADLLAGRGRVYGYDVFPSKVAALKRRAKRSQLNNIQGILLQEGEEAKTIISFEKTADLVLVDAPCSGWGVLKRNPDVKWRFQEEELRRLPQLQLQLLNLYSRLVQPGGRLVYSLCTFRKEETDAVVSSFLEGQSEWISEGGGYYGPGSIDGFYMHSFKRVAHR